MPAPPPPTTTPPPLAPRPREALVAWGAVTLVAAVLYRVPAVSPWFHEIVAAMLLYVPAMLVWREERELDDIGLRARPFRTVLAPSLVALAACYLVFYPPFVGGFMIWQQLACAHPHLHALAPGPCLPGRPALPPFRFRLPLDFGRLALAEVVVVALPEELFFRGYLMGRLQAWRPPTRRMLGAPVGAALVLQSALFAATHVVVQGNLATAMVFFPGLLFGWLRARTGSLVAGILFHASCNLLLSVLLSCFFG